jgi:hypothetical protein
MAKKTWKIGEYCKGGVITSEVNGNTVVVIGKDWDTSTGYRKSSNQRNAKEFTRITSNINNLYDVDLFLNDLTTHYHAEQVMEWIKSHFHNFKEDYA